MDCICALPERCRSGSAWLVGFFLIVRALVAFANTSGGVLLLGIEDGTKIVKGIPNILAEEERLANLIADSISPRLVPSIEAMPWRKTQVLAVEIYPSANRPHYLSG